MIEERGEGPAMSEFQYYEFVAVDRPLTSMERGELRALSTRARITPSSFVNDYQWGDLRGDPRVWMERYFDARLHLANWGARRIVLRLPCAAVRVCCIGRAQVEWRSCLAEDAGRMRRRGAARPQVHRSAFAGFRFPPEVITVAVRWHLRFGRSYRDVEELLAERRVEVDQVTVYRWVQRFTPLFADAARPLRHATGDRWFVDETYVKVAGRWRTCTGRSTSTGRSSTCCCPNSGTPPPPAGSSSAH
jgi:hypothetical protein